MQLTSSFLQCHLLQTNTLCPVAARSPAPHPAGTSQVSSQALRLLWFCSLEECLFSFLGVSKEMGWALCSRQWRKHFLLGLEEPFSSSFSMKRGFLGPPSDVAEATLLFQVAELWADVSHTTSSCLYSLQDVKLEIAQSSEEIIW